MIKITEQLLSEVSQKANISSRKRTNYNFHKEYSDPINRLLNAAQPGTYIQPHKHQNPDKVEVFIILKGKIVLIEYDDNGKIIDYAVLNEKGEIKGAEVLPGVWHSFIVLEKDSVVYEIKSGPYEPITDKNFASWAPKEGSPEGNKFIQKIIDKLKIE